MNDIVETSQSYRWLLFKLLNLTLSRSFAGKNEIKAFGVKTRDGCY